MTNTKPNGHFLVAIRINDKNVILQTRPSTQREIPLSMATMCWTWPQWDDHRQRHQDCERLAACWNACQGLPVDKIEAGTFEALFRTAETTLLYLLSDTEHSPISKQDLISDLSELLQYRRR